MHLEVIFVITAVIFCLSGFLSLILHLGVHKLLTGNVKPVRLPCKKAWSYWKSHPTPGHDEQYGLFEVIINGEVQEMTTGLLRPGKVGQMYDLLLDEQNHLLYEQTSYKIMKTWVKVTDIITIITGVESALTFPLFILAIL